MVFCSSAPQYLAETLHLMSDTEACRHLRSGSTSTLFMPATDDPVSAIGHFLWPQRDHGTLSGLPENSFILPNFSPRTQDLSV